jgi:hypothetical protein
VTLATGRIKILQGAMHLVLFAIFLLPMVIGSRRRHQAGIGWRSFRRSQPRAMR